MTAPYQKERKARAVVRADQLGSSERAGAELGIPARSIRRWQDDPEMAEYVQKTRDALADDVRAFAALAWAKLVERVRAGDIETRDLIIAAGVSTDKSQLLSGGATSRTETRAITEGLDDHERAALRDAIDAYVASREPASPIAAGDPG